LRRFPSSRGVKCNEEIKVNPDNVKESCTPQLQTSVLALSYHLSANNRQLHFVVSLLVLATAVAGKTSIVVVVAAISRRVIRPPRLSLGVALFGTSETLVPGTADAAGARTYHNAPNDREKNQQS
jgi:hypothetical protein